MRRLWIARGASLQSERVLKDRYTSGRRLRPMASDSTNGGSPAEKQTIANGEPQQVKLRILCLHGFRTSGKILAEQVKLANWEPLIDDIAEMVYFDAPWPARGKSDVEWKFPGPYFEWYQTNEDWTEAYGVEEAVSHISDFISLHGPFDGVMSFSQGAVFSGALIGLHEKGLGPNVPDVKFLIVVGGGRSRARTLKAAYSTKNLITCPSLHMIGEKDFMKPFGELLAAAFKDPIIVRHPSPHVIPKLDPAAGEIYRNFLLKQLECKLTPLTNGGLTPLSNGDASVSVSET